MLDLRRDEMIEVVHGDGSIIVGYFEGVYKGRIGIYTDPLEVGSFRAFNLSEVHVNKYVNNRPVRVH